MTAVNVSPAHLFRKVGCEEGSTILFDEIDTVFGPKAKENEEIRGLLNAGHRRGAVAGRCVVRGNIIETEEIPAYAAVALAGLGWLPDTILTRSAIIRMRRRHAGKKFEPFRRRIHAKDGDRVRSLIETWAAGFDRDIAWPELPTEIQDRDADVWEPLVAIADAVGGDWPKRARVAAVALVAVSKDVELSLGVRLAEPKGPFLLGKQPCMADAMFAPVCTRFVTYDVKLDPACAAYCKAVMTLPHMQEWIEAAKTEPDELEELDVEF